MFDVKAGLIFSMFALCGAAQGDVWHGAEWLRDPVFDGEPVLNLFHREKEPAPELSGPVNVHTLFRREITLKAPPVAATLAITGDDYYKFYVNGSFALQGPAPGYHFAYPFFWADITEHLMAGANCLAAHVYYQGLRNRVWNSADNRSGFMLALEVRYEDGSTERFVTDESWRCHQLDAFPTRETTGYQTQFLEHIDMRRIPGGWQLTGYDDRQWRRPLRERQDHALVRQITPPLQITRYTPKETRRMEDGRYWYDFGQVIVGHTRVRVQGEAGQVITVRHGEELLDSGGVRYEMRANCLYEEHPVLSGGSDTIEFYDYKSFRYVEILDAPVEPEVWVEVRHHPFDNDKAAFTSSHQLLTDIWALCRNGVKMGSQGGFLDCPSREKGQYLGDAVITARSHLWLTGDPTLTRKAIGDFSFSKEIHAGLMAVAPGNFMQEIAEYSLQFPMLTLEYYRTTGDRVVAEYVADEVLDGIFDYFAQYENDIGLLAGIDKKTGKWVLVDWPDNLRDGYDYDYSLKAGNTVLNAFYYGGLRAAAELQRLLGRSGEAHDARADRLAASFAAHLVNPETGLYLDAPGSSHSSLHANAVPLAFGLTEGADKERIIGHIRAKRLSCGVYIASYVLEGLFKAGAADLAYDLITSTDEHSWHEMLRHGATTCMEAWGPDQKWNTSWLHPWSSSPIYLIAEYVMGLSPAEPGWEKIRIAPAPVGGLPDIMMRAPLPQGDIVAFHTKQGGYTYMTPPDVPVELIAQQETPARVLPQPPPGIGPDAAALAEAGWRERVGDAPGLWVSVPKQELYVIEAGKTRWRATCSTALNGVGVLVNTNTTPPGWHRIAQKIGCNEPPGRIFQARQATSRVWRPGDETEEDLVLTRIFVLDGLEPGVNQGRDAQGNVVDSRERFIYIHGTNDEARLGQPVSHGCVRLSNKDVAVLFDFMSEGSLLYI
ncbi:MAG TPA: hypothetical protein ENN29_10145, partial [Candidatus Hydrogenedentes bacterium]|nr:hypothetical protein [Candidatus Hydrogenedentota bacterium]